eukprot:GGOE01022154.1.p1 GENE.GGOE01022154.1~~GGOE01022154.1.p1  ORF type:complete len:217 (-),score=16.76 GGOE01022154.1:106-756(-)
MNACRAAFGSGHDGKGRKGLESVSDMLSRPSISVHRHDGDPLRRPRLAWMLGKAMQTQMYFTGANTKCSVFPQHRHSDKRREYQHSFCSGSSAMLTAWAICHGRVCAPPDSTDNAPAPSPSLGSSTTPAAFNASVSSWPSCIKSDTTGGSIQPGPSPRWYVPATQMAQTQMSIRPPSSRRTPLSIPSPRATPVVRQQATVGRCDATRGCGVSNADC